MITPLQGADEQGSPTAVDYIFHGLFGLGMTYIAVRMIVALFSERVREKFRWGKGGGGPPMSRFSILMTLPLPLFVSARYIVAGLAMMTGHEKVWGVPHWWFFVCIALFFVGSAFDTFRNR